MIVLNRHYKKAIIFIHGFRSNSGFWLPYLTYFENYQLIFLNIDFVNQESFEKIKFEINNEIKKSDEIIAIISHSLGTFLSSFFAFKKSVKQFDICPVGFSLRINRTKFIKSISNKLQLDEQIINNDLNAVENIYYSKIFYKETDLKYLYIPTSDRFFKYLDSDFPKKIFNGDHFDIKKAIIDIKSHLEKFNN